MAVTRFRCVVIVAAKPPVVGKSRLAVPGDVRRELATAFARDVLSAASRTVPVCRVVLMTTDPELVELAANDDVRAVADPVPGDLNASFVAVARQVAEEPVPDLVVGLLADLPALRPEQLAEAIEAAAAVGGPAHVVDADGTGTSCYLAPPDRFAPRFGPGSAAAHQEDAARPLAGDWPGLRTDVDDLDDLRRAWALGVGTHTERALRDSTRGEPATDSPLGPS